MYLTVNVILSERSEVEESSGHFGEDWTVEWNRLSACASIDGSYRIVGAKILRRADACSG